MMKRKLAIATLGCVAASLVPVVDAGRYAHSASTQSSKLRDEWTPIPRTLSELLDSDYDIVAIVAASPQTRHYFLRKPGSFVRCSESASLREAPPPPVPPLSGTAATPTPGPGLPELPNRMVPPQKTTSQIDCSELTRTPAGRP